MSQQRASRGPQLPYRPIAGVIPCGSRWLVAAGRLQGITLTPVEPELLKTFIEVLDYRPSFEIIALGCPVGLLELPVRGGRSCDREARKLLGPRRGAAIVPPPIRPTLTTRDYTEARERNAGLSGPQWKLLPRIREVEEAIAPYWQRTVFEVHPELSFHQLNGDAPVKYSKHNYAGRDERRELLEKRLPNVERVLDARLPGARPHHLIDVAACLWTARRIAARGVARLPEDPEWDEQGLRMEIVR